MGVQVSGCLPFSVLTFPLSVYHYPPPPLRLTQRRTGECDPQRTQNDIQSFFQRPSSPPVSGGQFASAMIVFRFTFVTNSPPETGGVPRRGEGVDRSIRVSVFRFPFIFIHPLRRFTPRPPVSGGQLASAVLQRMFSVSRSPSLQGGLGWVLCWTGSLSPLPFSTSDLLPCLRFEACCYMHLSCV